MREFLGKYGIDFGKLGIYEFASIDLPWFSDEWKTNIEIELTQEHKDGDYVFLVIFVPDYDGIVKRTVVLAATLDVRYQLRKMFLAKNIRENIIPDLDGIDYSEKHSAYVTRDSTIFIITLERLLNRLMTQKPVYLEVI